jgi:hypothetical protein
LQNSDATAGKDVVRPAEVKLCSGDETERETIELRHGEAPTGKPSAETADRPTGNKTFWLFQCHRRNVPLAATPAHQMEQYTLKNVNNCSHTNIYSYLETSGGQSSNLYLNVVHFFSTIVN